MYEKSIFEKARETGWMRQHSMYALALIAGDSSSPGAAVAAIKELNAMHGYSRPEPLVGESSISQIVTEVVRQLEHK